MKKLYAYLEKQGIEFRKVTYGANYFYNAPALHFEGVTITFSYFTSDDRTTSAKHAQIIEKYCKRYGYEIFNRGGFPGVQYIHIMRADEKRALSFYESFAKKSADACAMEYHIRREMGLDCSDINESYKGIMEFYGEEYTSELANRAAVA